MPSRFNLPAELDIGEDEDFTKDRLDQAFNYLIQRLMILDSFRPGWDEQLNILRSTGLLRLNEAIQPIYETLVEIGQIGVMFTTTSKTPQTVSTGLKTFVLREEDWGRFAAAAYLSAQHIDDPENALFGTLQSYDRKTGTLTLLADQFSGAADETVSDWRISAAATPNVLTSAGQVGAYTKAEVDKLFADGVAPLASSKADKVSPILTGIPKAPTAVTTTNTDQIATTAFVTAAVAALKNFITNGSGEALDQFNELANAIGNDQNFSATMLSQLANRVRFDAAQSLTAAQKAQAIANIGGQASLGFTPVQQGGGTGQGTNKINIGWSSGSFLKAQVDTTDLGRVWTERDGALSNSDNGYQKLPSGLIVQWGTVQAGSADVSVSFPIAFPSKAISVVATPYGPPPATTLLSLTVDDLTRSSFSIRRRQVDNGGRVYQADPAAVARWIAVGV